VTDIAIASTALQNTQGGEDLASQLANKFKDAPDALIVFASSANDYGALLTALDSRLHPKTMVGCSSAGEFTTGSDGTGRTSAIAIRNPQMRFAVAAARNLTEDRKVAAQEIVRGFQGLQSSSFRYRTALVFVDALAGHAEDLVDALTLATAGMYQFVGGGAGDDGKFQKTHVFVGTEALTNAAVALEILSNKPIGIGAKHGWVPSGDTLRVTESGQSCVVSFNVAPAIEAFEEHAESTSQNFDQENPLPFFLHNVVGVQTDEGYKLRVPLGIGDRGAIMTAAEVPAGSKAHIMSTESASAVEAAAEATRSAVEQVERNGFKPKAALFFDCVATRLRLGQDFDRELDAVAKELDDAPFAGFNSYGQIVRAEGQFSGFHNCTAVVCVFPD
jgi:hypothetical protein